MIGTADTGEWREQMSPLLSVMAAHYRVQSSLNEAIQLDECHDVVCAVDEDDHNTHLAAQFCKQLVFCLQLKFWWTFKINK